MMQAKCAWTVPHNQLYLWIQNGFDMILSKKHNFEQAQETNFHYWITRNSINFPNLLDNITPVQLNFIK